MYLLYLDESGNTGTDLDNKHQPIFVLSGVCVVDKKWHEINDYFNNQKVSIYPDFENIEIHTNQLYNSNPKSPFYKNNWKYNLEILEKLTDLISSLDIKVIYSTIYKKQYKKIYGNNIIIDPYLYSFHLLSNSFNEFLNQNNTYGILFCDELSKLKNSLKILHPDLKNNKNIIEKTFYLDSKENNFIQIADFCSFYINKYVCIENELSTMDEYKKEHCLKVFKKISKLF